MKLVKFQDFLYHANFFYKTVGIRPYIEPWLTNPKRALYEYLVFYVSIINLNLNTFSEAVLVLLAFWNGNNFVEATVSLSYVCFDIVCSTKMLCIWLKKRQLNYLVLELYKMFPYEAKMQKTLLVPIYWRRCTHVTFAFSLLYMVLIWTYNLFAIAEWCFLKWSHKVETLEQMLPYTMYIPWNYQNHWSYYLLYASQSLAGYTSAAGQIASDLMLSALATQVVMHYDHVGRSIESHKLAKCLNNEHTDTRFLNEMIAYHDKVLRLSKVMNETFGVPLLINFMTSCFVICFVGFQLTIGETAWVDKFQLALFLTSSMAQLYLICHHGQLLRDASTNVASAVYSHNWSEAKLEYKKMLISMLQRAQEPALLKATTLVHVSRDTMTDLMQLSYKFFALLRTMYVK